MKFYTILGVLLSTAIHLSAQKNADCVTAMDICKKQSYSIDHTGGEGADRKEADFVACFMNGENFGQAEENSTWIKFEVKQGGSLTFTITPHRAQDDIDFVVFKLPANGDCTQKQIVRCMAAGDSESDAGSSRCMGKTGLRNGEKDTSEDAGCGDADDNTWLAPLKVVKGEKYVILVSNVSSSGPGFDISFSGTAKLPCDEEPLPVIAEAKPPKPASSTTKKPTIKPTKTQPIPQPDAYPPAPVSIGGRTVSVAKTITVKNFKLDVSVWDNQIEDGDVISLYIDDKKMISNILLTKKPKEFLITMDKNVAYLIVYAEDFGKAEPNTASIKVKDGVTEQTFVLKAARGSQEAIRVVKE
ncbi:MAG: hypothetical protein WCR52_07680 [Bacteroidota bacterium]